MKIQAITSFLETIAPASLQESYDNAGLITGNLNWECSGVITTLDATEAVVLEAIEKKCNLIVAHHPIIFGGLKKITGKNYVEQTVITAIKNDIAIYAIHTNLDNVMNGVNGKMADMLGLINRRILSPKKDILKKLITFAPVAEAEKVRNAIFAAGGGYIGNYSECSFTTSGQGTFNGNEFSTPEIGEKGERAMVEEVKIEVIFPTWINENILIDAVRTIGFYEEVAYDVIPLENIYQNVGSGMVGELPEAMSESEFLNLIKNTFNIYLIRHTPLLAKPVQKVALCGGAGSFLISNAVAAQADFYLTGDVKYHEFFDANNKLVIADIGHYESEQYTIDLLFDLLSKKFPNFAVLKTGVKTNPVNYFTPNL
ncbi:Nif3-like dinuclear metal center hexameric protein [Ferruginibacter sp. SUN002]|uniref:Nif3-like dinuclear metal center hexameric protein n=1 Tax=Ferruginibacter sp. SUN002 TaxID=2937789 RepID=UPI003D35A50F